MPTAGPTSEPVTLPTAVDELKPDQLPKPMEYTPEPTQQPTPAATPPPTGPPPAPPKSAARARSIKKKPSKAAPTAPSDPSQPGLPAPAVPLLSDRPPLPEPATADVPTTTPPLPMSTAPATNPLPTPPIAAVPAVPTPDEALSTEPSLHKARSALPQIPTDVRTSLAESTSTASVVNPATPPALATQHERDSMSDESFGREGLGRSALPAPPLLSVSTKDLSDGVPVTPVTTSALTDTTFDSPLPSSLGNSPYPGRDWSHEQGISRPPSRPLSPDGSSGRGRPKSMPLSPQPPAQEPLPAHTATVPASGSETFGLVAHAQTEIEEPIQERTSQKTPTPQSRTADALHVPLPAKSSETAAEPAPVAPRLPTAEIQRPQPPPPPRRLPQNQTSAVVLPGGALPSRSSSRTGSIPPPLASAPRVDSPRLNGSPRLGGAPDGTGRMNGPAKQSPFSRLNTSNNSSPQPGSSPKQTSTPTAPQMPDVPRTLHRSASMSSAGSSQGARSAVSPVSVFSPTMPVPPPVPVPGHDGAEFLAEPEMHPTKAIEPSGGNGVGGVAGMAGVGAAFAARQALAAHSQENTPVVEWSPLTHVPVRRSSRRARNSTFIGQNNEQRSLAFTEERPSLESSARPSIESSRSSLGRSNSLGSVDRNRPTVTAGWRSRTTSMNSLASAAGSSGRKRPLGSRPMRSASTSTTNTPPMVMSHRIASPEPIPSVESATPRPDENQTGGEVMKNASAKPAEPVESLSHPVVRQLSLSQSQSTSTSGVATPDSGRSIGHRKTPSGNRKPAPPIDRALIEALKQESVSSDLERLQRSTPTTPLAPPAVSPFIPIEKKEPPVRVMPKKVPPPLPLTATMLNIVPPADKSVASSDATAVPKGPMSPGLLSPTTPVSPRAPISPVSSRHSISSEFMARMNMPNGNSNQSRLSQRMSNRLSQFSARMSRRISSDSGHHHRPYMEDSAGAYDFEQSQASVVNAALVRQSTARSVSLSNGRMTPARSSAPSSQASQASLPLPSHGMNNGDYRSARDMTGPVEGMVIITADTPVKSSADKSTASKSSADRGASSKETSSSSYDKGASFKEEDTGKEDNDNDAAKIEQIEKPEKKENGIKRKVASAAQVVDLSDSPQIQQSATLSPPMNTEHFSAVSPQFVNAPRQPSAGVSPSLEASAALLREQRSPETPQMSSPTITSPPSSLDRHSSLSHKLRLGFRSKPSSEAGTQHPDFHPITSPVASPPSPTLSSSPNPNRSSIHGSLGRAFRLRAGSSGGGHQPMKGTSPGGISSEDFKHLHEKEALHGLGLGMAFPPNSYRTPSGGLGYTPPVKKGRTVSNISAEDALANIRQKNIAEQEEAQERWRRLEGERAQHRTSGPLSPTSHHFASRVQSLSSSTGLSDDEQPLSHGRISEASERTHSFTEPEVGRPIMPRSSLAERPKPHKRLSSRDLGARESMQSLSSCGSPPRSPEVPRSQTRDSIATVFSAESVRSHRSDVRESKVSLEPDVRSVISPRSSYETTMSPERPERTRTSFGQLSERERGSLYRASTFEPRLSRDTMRSTRSNGSRTSFERSGRVSRTSFEPPSRMSRDNSFLASPRGLEPPDVNEQPLDEETESERGARLEAEAAEEARLEAERAERAAAKRAEAERREAERVAAQQRAEEERRRQEAERAARRAEELARRDLQQAEVRQQLVKGKAEGAAMLRGWVTVQGVGTWRRRYFLLLPDALQLFKGEGDDKPISTVTLGAKTTIDHDVYEEAQVRGAWKICGERREEFFMFADSETDRTVIMEGFRIATGREV